MKWLFLGGVFEAELENNNTMNEIDNQHQSNLRHGRISLPDHAYFITKCIDRDNPVDLSVSNYADIIIESLLWMKGQNWFRVCGFVIMPDHYHLLLALTDKKSLSQIMESLGKFTGRRLNKIVGSEGSFWEEGFYDHCLRDRKDFDKIIEYIHYNPVRKGLVENPDQWPYSTASDKFSQIIDWDWLGYNLKV